LPKSGMTDLDFEISTSSMMDTECVIEVRPMLNTYEEFFCGLTADSHPSFKMTTAFEGTMDRRGGPPFEVSALAREFLLHACSTQRLSSGEGQVRA